MPQQTASSKTATDAGIAQAAAWATEIRHDLHAHPELGYNEHRTAGVVRKKLDEINVDHVDNLAGGTATVAHIPATNNPKDAPTIALRADMDALPIIEETGKPYTSTVAGIMHACGHDGHTANLLGTAKVIAETPERQNNTLLIFQPAEEGGAGADKLCQEGALDGSLIGEAVDQIYALHGWPELVVGKLETRAGPLLAATDEFAVTINAKGGHAAYPHRCVDPIVIASHIVTALQSIASRRVAPHDSVVVTVGAIHAGSTFNVIPDSAHLKGTIRTLTDQTRKLAEEEFRLITSNVAEAFGASVDIEWHTGYPSTFNHAGPTRRFAEIAGAALGEENIIHRKHASMGGEDFSFYALHVPACFFFLGIRPEGYHTYPGLHTPRFDFNDQAFPIGIDMFRRLALEPA